MIIFTRKLTMMNFIEKRHSVNKLPPVEAEVH